MGFDEQTNSGVEMVHSKNDRTVGLHTGPVMAGVVGRKKFTYDIWSDAVNVASLMESTGEAGRIVISESTYHCVKDEFECERRGPIEGKNKGVLDSHFLNRSKPVISRHQTGHVRRFAELKT